MARIVGNPTTTYNLTLTLPLTTTFYTAPIAEQMNVRLTLRPNLYRNTGIQAVTSGYGFSNSGFGSGAFGILAPYTTPLPANFGQYGFGDTPFGGLFIVIIPPTLTSLDSPITHTRRV